MGLGAGAGNAQLENIVANLARANMTNLELGTFLRMSQKVEDTFTGSLPRTNASSIESGLSGVFSGYAPQVKQISKELGLEVSELWQEMGKRKLVAGQESMIREIANDLMNL